MQVDIETIARRRHLALTVLRSVAVALFVAGSVIAGWQFQSRMGRYTGFEYLVLPVVALLGSFWIPAAALAIGGRGFARWLCPVPGPSSECPQCGYSLKNLKAPICPECGLSLRAPIQPGQK